MAWYESQRNQNYTLTNYNQIESSKYRLHGGIIIFVKIGRIHDKIYPYLLLESEGL